jgi:hypothetical protein
MGGPFCRHYCKALCRGVESIAAGSAGNNCGGRESGRDHLRLGCHPAAPFPAPSAGGNAAKFFASGPA